MPDDAVLLSHGQELHTDMPENLKYICNVNITNMASIHNPKSGKKNATDFELPVSQGYINHYRFLGDDFASYKPSTERKSAADTLDDTLLKEAPALLRALENRYGMDIKSVWKFLASKHPPELGNIFAEE